MHEIFLYKPFLLYGRQLFLVRKKLEEVSQASLLFKSNMQYFCHDLSDEQLSAIIQFSVDTQSQTIINGELKNGHRVSNVGQVEPVPIILDR